LRRAIRQLLARDIPTVRQQMEEIIIRFAEAAGRLTDTAAIAVVIYGVVEAFLGLLRVMVRPRVSHGERKVVWRRFGFWLLLGLEFELAADIIGSIVSPTWQDIGQLGAIAAIRTFVNYFLEQDLERAEKETDFVASTE
jgi:uncharacterized membrane protein